ncbi:MAG: NUDIX hydrolase [Jatrophihabitantaceae bacterium]
MSELPGWLRPLAGAIRDAGPLQFPSILAPEDAGARESAVLIAFCELVEGPGVLLIERAATLRRHAGQVAFPGGALDPGDADHEAAALREASEEVGLDPRSVHPIAELPPIFIARSGYVVTPIVAWWQAPHPVAPVDAGEVARVAVVAIAELVDSANRFRVRHPSGLVGPGFDVQGMFVWGFTAVLLDALLSLAGWNRPWDESRERPLPERISGVPPTLPRS